MQMMEKPFRITRTTSRKYHEKSWLIFHNNDITVRLVNFTGNHIAHQTLADNLNAAYLEFLTRLE